MGHENEDDECQETKKMGHENEGDDEIEQHLILKITHAIESQDDFENPVIKEANGVIIILKQKNNEKVGENWPSVRRENLYYLNNLFTEWQMTRNLQITSSSKAGQDTRDDNIKKSLKKMKKEVTGEQEASSRGQLEGSVSQHLALYPHQEPKHLDLKRHKGDVYRWSSRHGPRKVLGLGHIVMAMERDLVMRKVDDPFKVFGITGVAGIGKTTLCQQIFNRVEVKKHFCPRIWVCLSKQPRDRAEYKEEVVVRMLKCLGIEDEIINNAAKGSDGDEIIDNAAKGSDGLKRLILLLRLQLIGKRYLLVLDDAWYDVKDDNFFCNLTQKEQMDENWGHELAYALPKGCGGTIICTSRSQTLLKKMLGKEVSMTVMKRQTEAITEEIFRDNVIGYGNDEKEEFPQYLEDLKKEILKKCDGIPLAATLLAKIARRGLPDKKPKEAPPSDGVARLKDGGAVQDGTLAKPKNKNAQPSIRSDQRG